MVAVTNTGVGEPTEGAVNNPVLEIVPALADHVTEVVDELFIVAANCWVSPEVTVAAVGEIAKPEAGFVGELWPGPVGLLAAVLVPPAQPTLMVASSNRPTRSTMK